MTGNTAIVSEILDEDFVHHENTWRRKKLIVGPEAMADWVIHVKKAYPDLFVEPVDFGTGSTEHLFVQFEGSSRNGIPKSAVGNAVMDVGVGQIWADCTESRQLDIIRHSRVSVPSVSTVIGHASHLWMCGGRR